ncbi:proteinase-activated receptor 4-like isoform X2 [Neoarius graeffei]|uniref:proteinase-activated receptor 4-like isoform X2 n=2 Tax=Neoarius graeffei TaxID=443677 RepID=UPI00298C8A08|nr:proteinase-activated receptor 4-like isoform X2 [Neoarius graeffei]
MSVAVSNSCVVFFVLVSILSLTHVSSTDTGIDNDATIPEYTGIDNDSTIPPNISMFIINNNGTLTKRDLTQIQAATTVLLVPLLYLISFVFGFPSNLLALWVLLFHTKKFPSTILLVNLTCCDLLLLLMLPFRIIYHFQGNNWMFGEGSCRLLIALFYGNMYGSVVCLALIAVDRYVAVVHPFGARMLRSVKTSMLMSVMVWTMVLIAAVPMLASRQSYFIKDLSITTCHDALPEEEQKKYMVPYFATLFFLCFLIPLFVVVFCYSAVLRTLVAAGARYTHAIRVTALILVVFIVCLLPSNVLLLMHYSKWFYSPKSTKGHDGSSDNSDQLYVPYMISLAISTFNSCIDPFIFYYVSEDFRGKVGKLLCCTKNSYESSSGSSSGTTRSKVTLLSEKSKGLSEKDTINL